MNEASYIYGTDTPSERPVFFASYEFTADWKKTFVDLGINRVPVVAWLKPEVAKFD